MQAIAAGEFTTFPSFVLNSGLTNDTTLKTELSNEIRGERLRFIEAMKEATAINIGGTSMLFLL